VRLMPEFLAGCGAEIGGDYPGVLQKFNPLATVTSRGCIRMCKFCSVPIIEGLPVLQKFGKRQIELEDWLDRPVICDNNILANSIEHFDRVCDRLEKWDWCDFNQGVDSRLLNEHHAERFARLKRSVIRPALDSLAYVDKWDAAIDLLFKFKIAKQNIRAYAIIGFGTSPDESWAICKHIEARGIKPLPQWFHELDALEHNIVTERQRQLGWNDYERRRLMQWFYQHTRAVA